MDDHEYCDKLETAILSLDGIAGPTIRQRLMLETLNNIKSARYELKDKITQLQGRILELEHEAELYRELAEQRLLNHLNIDQEHIINICNESLQEVATDELSPMALFADPGWTVPTIQPTTEPLSIPPIPITEIDFQHDPT